MVCFEGVVIREHFFRCSRVFTACCIRVVLQCYLVSVNTDDGL